MSTVLKFPGRKAVETQAPKRRRGDAQRALSFATRLEEAARLIRLAMHEDAPFIELAPDERLSLAGFSEYLERKAEKAEIAAVQIEARSTGDA